MPFNRIAVYGHRGWASSVIVRGLASTGAPIRILYRPGSDISRLPDEVTAVEVDVFDKAALLAAIGDIDIVMYVPIVNPATRHRDNFANGVICSSLVGHEGVTRQHHLVDAITHSDVQLFVPSDLAARYDTEGLSIPVNAAKMEVEEAAKKAGIATTIVLPGNFAEFVLSTPSVACSSPNQQSRPAKTLCRALGIDLDANRVTYFGNSAEAPLSIWYGAYVILLNPLLIDHSTREYVAAAYGSLFAQTPIEQLRDRQFSITELSPTGHDISRAMEARHGSQPLTTSIPIASVSDEVARCLTGRNRFSLMWYCRKIWSTGEQIKMIGGDTWDVAGYRKMSIQDLVVDGKLQQYREVPPEVLRVMKSLDTTP
jgi:hypothetical protein